MENNVGYIKIHRKIRDNFLWKNKPFTKLQAWIDILLEVRWKEEPDKRLFGNQMLICYRGESLNSTKTWAERWGWSRASVKRFLKLLQTCSMVVIKPCKKTTHLKVVNFSKYQNQRTTSEPHLNHTWTTLEPQVTTEEEGLRRVKNVNNNSDDDFLSSEPTLEQKELADLFQEVSTFTGVAFMNAVQRERLQEWCEKFGVADIRTAIKYIRQRYPRGRNFTTLEKCLNLRWWEAPKHPPKSPQQVAQETADRKARYAEYIKEQREQQRKAAEQRKAADAVAKAENKRRREEDKIFAANKARHEAEKRAAEEKSKRALGNVTSEKHADTLKILQAQAKAILATEKQKGEDDAGRLGRVQ